MSDIQDLVEQYMSIWNVTDPADRKAALAKMVTQEITFCDPLATADGLDAVDATIGAVQGQFPDFTFRVVGTADAHHDLVRFVWGLGPAGGEDVVVGTDILVITPDGAISGIYGFLDKVPA